MKQAKAERVGIIRLSSLGDIIHTIPAVHYLKKTLPGSKICWVVSPPGDRLLELFTGIDQVITVDFKKQGWLAKISELQRIRGNFASELSLVIDFQGLLKAAVVGRALHKHVVGFDRSNLRERHARLFYWKTAPIADENGHVILKNLFLARYFLEKILQVNPPAIQIEYPLKELPPSEKLNQFYRKFNLTKKKFSILNIGGAWETKILTIGQYADILKLTQPPMVILWGNSQEEDRAKAICQKYPQAIQAPFLDFPELFVMIRDAGFIITADTLALHVADVVNTPSIGIFGPTSPARNGSLLKESAVVEKKLACGCCYRKKCAKMDCIKGLDFIELKKIIRIFNEKFY